MIHKPVKIAQQNETSGNLSESGSSPFFGRMTFYVNLSQQNLILNQKSVASIIEKPEIIQAAGNKPKQIEEYFGRVSSHSPSISIARMLSPAGWKEPGQRPEFDEYTVVLKGLLHVRTEEREYRVKAGQAIQVKAGEWVQYSSPEAEGAEYIAVCLPAFSPETVHRDE